MIDFDDLNAAFPAYKLTTERTLFENDFYDTHYRYFDQIDDKYLSATNMSEKDLILEWGFEWPEFYINIAIEAAQTRSRPKENISTWKDVTYEYLYYFGDNCCYLSPEGFKFFLPAAFLQYFSNVTIDRSFMDFFVSRFKLRWSEDRDFFNEKQIECTKKFINNECHGNLLL